jgi:hypothetical protein
MIQKDVIPMFPPLGYRSKASAHLSFDLDDTQSRLPPIKTKGPAGSTPRHAVNPGSPKTPSSTKSTPRRSITPSRSGTSTPKGSQSPRRSTSPGRGLSTKRTLTCWKCNGAGHAYYDTKCPQYEAGWEPPSRADTEGGTRRGATDDKWRK